MTGGPPRLLVTGFGPFPGMPHNPSAALARRLGRSVRLRLALGGPPRVLVLPTTYAGLDTHLAPALSERPAAVLMIGVASRAARVRVETCARNRSSRLAPDAAGRAAGRARLDPAAPAMRRSPAAAGALAVLRRHGIPAHASNDPGRYLCNAGYFRALAEPCPVLFVHVPPVPRVRRPEARPGRQRPGAERQAAALAEIAVRLVGRAPARAHRAGTPKSELEEPPAGSMPSRS